MLTAVTVLFSYECMYHNPGDKVMTKLHIVNGLNRGESHDIRRDIITVGRAPDNDIQLKDNFVSRQHLKIRRKGNRYFVEDLKSSNGTFVNGRQIRPGVELEIGEGTHCHWLERYLSG